MDRPAIIYITGLDGSGKTTLINMLAEELGGKRGWPVKVVWLRMSHYLSKPLLAFCRIVGLTEYKMVNGVKVGRHHFYRSKIVSYSYIFLRGIDTWLDALIRVYIPARLFGKTVICDRYVLDALIDLMVDTHRELEKTFLWNRLSNLIPEDTPVFLIERDDKFIEECRPETPGDQSFPHRKALYSKVFANRAKPIDNNSPIKSAFDEILKEIL